MEVFSWCERASRRGLEVRNAVQTAQRRSMRLMQFKVIASSFAHRSILANQRDAGFGTARCRNRHDELALIGISFVGLVGYTTQVGGYEEQSLESTDIDSL